MPQILILIIMILNKVLDFLHFKFKIVPISLDRKKKNQIPLDMEKSFRKIYKKCENYTMTSIERMFSLFKAVEYIVKNEVSGDIVECGVWRGGSMMLTALNLIKLNDIERKIYLYDTYEGMSSPTNKDIKISNNELAIDIMKNKFDNENKKWSYSPIEVVKKNLFSTKYPRNNLIFVKGKVEHTIPMTTPKKISILRLDTDWYESTYHELNHLFPKLVKNGILILDDYGHWKGAKDAADKYFVENNIKIFLIRIDYTGRIAIKL